MQNKCIKFTCLCCCQLYMHTCRCWMCTVRAGLLRKLHASSHLHICPIILFYTKGGGVLRAEQGLKQIRKEERVRQERVQRTPCFGYQTVCVRVTG